MNSRYEVQCAYDGKVPAHMLEGLPEYPPALLQHTAQQQARVGKVTVKPDAIRARMVKTLTDMAGRTISVSDLKQVGFTEAEIAAYGPDAIREVLVRFPLLDSMTWTA